MQISFGYGLFTGALGLHYGLEKLGATVIPASSGNSEKQLMMLRDFGVTGLVATPSYAIYLSEMVREGEYPLSAYKLRHGILGSEGCTAEMRERIEKNFGINVTDNYGMTELGGPGVSGECEYRCGLHFAEDAFLPEGGIQQQLSQVVGEDSYRLGVGFLLTLRGELGLDGGFEQSFVAVLHGEFHLVGCVVGGSEVEVGEFVETLLLVGRDVHADETLFLCASDGEQAVA